MDAADLQGTAEMATSRPALWQVFQAKATALGARVEQVEDAPTVAEMLPGETDGLIGTSALAAHFPQIARRCASVARVGYGRERAPAREVITLGRFGVAETGSVLVCEDNAGRAACFLAERLWLLVPEDEIVSTLDEALARMADLVREGAAYMTLMSGPSRTADIERVVTIGVHGPREVVIVVVGA